MNSYVKLCLIIGSIGLILGLLIYPIEKLNTWIRNEEVIFRGRLSLPIGDQQKSDLIFIGKDKRTANLIREYYLKNLDTVNFNFNETWQVKIGEEINVLAIDKYDTTILFIETEAKTIKGSSEKITGYITREFASR